MNNLKSTPVTARDVFASPIHFLAFGFGAGLAPIAPGTVGTMVGIPVFVGLHFFGLPIYLAITALLFVLGCYLCGESAKRLGTHDHGGIVFDEIVAFLVTMLPTFYFPQPEPLWRWVWLLSGFALFRFFDVLKPWPINLADRHVHGGFGIMLDDLLAASYAGGLLTLAMWLQQSEALH